MSHEGPFELPTGTTTLDGELTIGEHEGFFDVSVTFWIDTEEKMPIRALIKGVAVK